MYLCMHCSIDIHIHTCILNIFKVLCFSPWNILLLYKDDPVNIIWKLLGAVFSTGSLILHIKLDICACQICNCPSKYQHMHTISILAGGNTEFSEHIWMWLIIKESLKKGPLRFLQVLQSSTWGFTKALKGGRLVYLRLCLF